METGTHVFFYGHKPNNLGVNVFSQWYMINFSEKIKGKKWTYTSAEQYMMAQKALLFGDEHYFTEIMATNDPKKIKQYGRLIKNFDPDVWDEHKFEIVVQGNRLKFGQNPELMERLMKTKKKIIVEASPFDKIWGIGITAAEAIKIPENKWPGENLLGKALMTIRDE